MTTVACIVIASERRQELVGARVMPSVLSQCFDEVVLIGDWMPGRNEKWPEPIRYICVEPMLRNTIDALVKRDVGALATTADVLVYLCDDHRLGPNFLVDLREVIDEEWDVIVPNRFCIVPKVMVDVSGKRPPEVLAGSESVVSLNNGERDGYCGGHGGIFRRHVITRRPWSAHSHTPYWDARSSFAMRLAGARFVWHPRAGIAIEDIEPNAQPWK